MSRIESRASMSFTLTAMIRASGGHHRSANPTGI
jgi:hypothetical protein